MLLSNEILRLIDWYIYYLNFLRRMSENLFTGISDYIDEREDYKSFHKFSTI